MVLVANWRLANAKSSMAHENNPGAAGMDETHRKKDGEKSRCTGNITPAKLLCQWLQWLRVVVGRADFDFFVRFENTASCINASRQAGSSQLRLHACVVAL